jgi:hypothetical protein
MKKALMFYFVYFFIFLICRANADEVRVDSVGDLSLVMTDETTEITPYMLGNPAGLALLNPQIRLEVTVPWYSETGANGAIYWKNFGISPIANTEFTNLETSMASFNSTYGSQYQGFLYVTPDKWAVQVAGSFDETAYQFDAPSGQSQNGQELIRVSRDWGALTLGTELQITQVNGTGPSLRENNSSSAWISNTGLLVNLPIGEGDQKTWLHFGGSFSFDLSPTQFTSLANASTLQGSNLVFEPCAFLEIPKIFQAGIVANIYSSSQTFTSQYFIPQDYLEADNNLYLAALYKWKMVLSNQNDVQPLSFNHGLLLQVNSFQGTDKYQTQGTFNNSDTQLQIQLGLGLEREKDFMVGLQGNWFEDILNQQNSEFPPTQNYSVATFRLSLGGEKWITPNWALRLGLTYQNDQDQPSSDGGGTSIWDDFYPIFPSQQITGLLVSVGAGYENQSFKVNGMIWYEGSQVALLPGDFPSIDESNYSYSVYGAQLSVAVFLNQ